MLQDIVKSCNVAREAPSYKHTQAGSAAAISFMFCIARPVLGIKGEQTADYVSPCYALPALNVPFCFVASGEPVQSQLHLA